MQRGVDWNDLRFNRERLRSLSETPVHTGRIDCSDLPEVVWSEAAARVAVLVDVRAHIARRPAGCRWVHDLDQLVVEVHARSITPVEAVDRLVCLADESLDHDLPVSLVVRV